MESVELFHIQCGATFRPPRVKKVWRGCFSWGGMGFTCAELGHSLVAKTFRKFLCSKRMHTQKYIQVILLHISREWRKWGVNCVVEFLFLAFVWTSMDGTTSFTGFPDTWYATQSHDLSPQHGAPNGAKGWRFCFSNIWSVGWFCEDDFAKKNAMILWKYNKILHIMISQSLWKWSFWKYLYKGSCPAHDMRIHSYLAWCATHRLVPFYWQLLLNDITSSYQGKTHKCNSQ